jgi:hypothetical protein
MLQSERVAAAAVWHGGTSGCQLCCIYSWLTPRGRSTKSYRTNGGQAIHPRAAANISSWQRILLALLAVGIGYTIARQGFMRIITARDVIVQALVSIEEVRSRRLDEYIGQTSSTGVPLRHISPVCGKLLTRSNGAVGVRRNRGYRPLSWSRRLQVHLLPFPASRPTHVPKEHSRSSIHRNSYGHFRAGCWAPHLPVPRRCGAGRNCMACKGSSLYLILEIRGEFSLTPSSDLTAATNGRRLARISLMGAPSELRSRSCCVRFPVPAGRNAGCQAVQAPLRSVRAGSVSQRCSTGINGHQWSQTVRRNRRSPTFRLRRLGGCMQAIRIVVPTVEKRVRHPRLCERAPMSPRPTGL